jgi:hypothetical protein
VDAVGWCTFFIGLIRVFVFDILQSHSGLMQICSGCCTPLTTGPRRPRLSMQMYWDVHVRFGGTANLAPPQKSVSGRSVLPPY